MSATGIAGTVQVPAAEMAVSTLLLRPEDAFAVYVLGHGAGAGMNHVFMEGIAGALATRGVATLRYNFPYVERGRSGPDPQSRLVATVRAAVAAATETGLPLVAGGKSMGGRMTSLAAAEEPLPSVRGLAFLGFPLHSPAKPGAERAAHLAAVTVPMLFLQGTRDRLARMDLLRPVLDDLGDRATLHVVDDGDHSFKVPKRAGRTAEEVTRELADTVAAWTRKLVAG